LSISAVVEFSTKSLTIFAAASSPITFPAIPFNINGAHLKESHKVKSIYFSAWEDDFTSDPLIAILGELKVYIEENHSALKNNWE
jgi:hypothetical protein